MGQEAWPGHRSPRLRAWARGGHAVAQLCGCTADSGFTGRCDRSPGKPPHTPGEHKAPTLSLSCWHSCRETVKKTRASLSHGTTHSTLCTWLTSRRWGPHSLRTEGVLLREWHHSRAPPHHRRPLYLQHGPGTVQHCAPRRAEILRGGTQWVGSDRGVAINRGVA